ncbi:hypothetical protein HDE_09823 [Halotydeus destructor]|nr:hypothetical protein HDE_09823 [Halotydeus destructor]
MKTILAIFALCLASVSAATFDATCECYAQISWGKAIRASQLLKELFNDAPKAETCDDAGFQDCVHYCGQKVGHITNNFDLAKVPQAVQGGDIVLGQHLCNLVGRDVHDAPVVLMAKFSCSHSASGDDFAHNAHQTMSMNTGHQTIQNLFCTNGKFENLQAEKEHDDENDE